MRNVFAVLGLVLGMTAGAIGAARWLAQPGGTPRS